MYLQHNIVTSHFPRGYRHRRAIPAIAANWRRFRPLFSILISQAMARRFIASRGASFFLLLGFKLYMLYSTDINFGLTNICINVTPIRFRRLTCLTRINITELVYTLSSI